MSFINLLGNLMCPQYPACYVVENKFMREARNLPGVDDPPVIFEGVVGTLLEENEDSEKNNLRSAIPQPDRLREVSSERNSPPCVNSPGFTLRKLIERLKWLPIMLLPAMITIGITGALSKFRHGRSTPTQRGVFLAWILEAFAIETLLRLNWPYTQPLNVDDLSPRAIYFTILRACFYLLFWMVVFVPAVWGYVIVGKMLKEYGVCTLMS
jgi:hypothetical protein